MLRGSGDTLRQACGQVFGLRPTPINTAVSWRFGLVPEEDFDQISRSAGNIWARRSFWMIPILSSIVIMNLIANLPFLYHKPETTAVTRID